VWGREPNIQQVATTLPHRCYNKGIMSELIEHMEEVNRVAAEYIKGFNETEISKELDIPRARVSSLLREWKNLASNSEAVRARAREALSGADQHYSKLIKQAYEVIDEASVINNLSAKTAAIKLILDIESKRIDMLQKAGLLENKELADQLLETERKQELLMKILTDVSGKCPTCKIQVLSRLSNVSGPTGEAVVINEH
jgi:predicted transcriptional regulator